ncbi:MAG: Ig-like domain-containing protein [Actinomycetota bacterium]
MATKSVKPLRGRVLAITLGAVIFLALATLGGVGASLARGGGPEITGPAPSSQPTVPTPTPTPRPTPVLRVSPADGVVDVRPDALVTVGVSLGTLDSVTLMENHGGEVTGKTGPDGEWHSVGLLRPSTEYTVFIAATGPDGLATSVSSIFTTLSPKVTATYSVSPNGSAVGVGMPVIVHFDSAVTTKARRAEVEKRVKVTTVPVQAGAWGWLDERQLMWRPEHYWVTGTKVSVSTPLHGVQTGDDKWVKADATTTFTVGPSMVSTVDMRKHTLTVRRNGVVIRTFPVSTGKPGPLTETRSGIKVIIERNSKLVMDSATVGIPKTSPDYYKITTQWNLRLTWTGEFIHSAPWSVNSQGTENVSHGCTNMAPKDAEWMFKNSRVGDVVVFTGGDRVFKPHEGYGVWVYSYAGWSALSALA